MSQAGIVTSSSSNYISISPYIVGTPGDTHAGYTTIQDGINAAHAAGATGSAPLNIYVKPGTYTENLTIFDGINVVGLDAYVLGSGYAPAAILNGTITNAPSALNTKLQNMQILTPAASIQLNIVNGCNFFFKDCFINTQPGSSLLSIDGFGSIVTFEGCFAFGNGALCFSSDIGGATTLNFYNCIVEYTTISTCANALTFNFNFTSLLALTLNSSTSSGNIAVNSLNSSIFGFITSLSDPFSLISLVSYSSTFTSCSFTDAGGGLFVNSYDCSFITSVISSSASFSSGNFNNCSFGGSNNAAPASTFPDIAVYNLSNCDNIYFINPQAGNYTTKFYDYQINCTTGGHTITLNATGLISGISQFLIKDASGTAFASNITINGNGNNIDGTATYNLNANYQSTTLIWNGTQWNKV